MRAYCSTFKLAGSDVSVSVLLFEAYWSNLVTLYCLVHDEQKQVRWFGVAVSKPAIHQRLELSFVLTLFGWR